MEAFTGRTKIRDGRILPTSVLWLCTNQKQYNRRLGLYLTRRYNTIVSTWKSGK